MLHILVALVPVLLIAFVFYFFDKNREPVRIVLRAFLFGIFSVGLFIIIHLILPKLNPGDSPLREALVRAFYTASFKEELAKLCAFLLALYRHRHFDEWYDGILYGIMVGLGFAFVENLFYFYDTKKDLAMLYFGRSVLSMPLHALLGGMMGYFVGKAKFTFNKSRLGCFIFLAFFFPFIVHGLFDFVLMYYAVQLAWVSIPIIIFLWGWIFKMKKNTQQRQSLLI